MLGVLYFSLGRQCTMKSVWQFYNKKIVLTNVNPIAPRKVKIVYNFGISEYNRVNINNEFYLSNNHQSMKVVNY